MIFTTCFKFIFAQIMQHIISQRINFLIDHYTDGNVSSFSRKLEGVNTQTLNRIFNRDLRNDKYPTPSTELLIAICTAFPEVNANWLLMGIGDTFVKKDNQSNDNDWKEKYLQLVDEKEILTKKYMSLLEKLANP